MSNLQMAAGAQYAAALALPAMHDAAPSIVETHDVFIYK